MHEDGLRDEGLQAVGWLPAEDTPAAKLVSVFGMCMQGGKS